VIHFPFHLNEKMRHQFFHFLRKRPRGQNPSLRTPQTRAGPRMC